MLELIHVSKTFNPGTPNARPALRDVNLHVKKGDFISIIGANGAGKSTLFNAICGSFLTDEGQIILDGKDITLLPEYKRAKNIGRLFQDPMKGSAPGMSIEENLALASGKGGWLSAVGKKDKEEFRERLALLDMGSRIIMMNAGSVIFDAEGDEKSHLTVADLMEQFKIAAGKALDTDRMLL